MNNKDSLLDVESVSNKLTYSVRLKTHYGPTYFDKKTLVQETLPIKIAAGASLVENSAVLLSLNLNSAFCELEHMNTTLGTLIDCIYSHEVSVDMAGVCMCCGQMPSLESIVKIVPGPIIAPLAVAPPPNWNPVILNPVVLAYDPKYEVSA